MKKPTCLGVHCLTMGHNYRITQKESMRMTQINLNDAAITFDVRAPNGRWQTFNVDTHDQGLPPGTRWRAHITLVSTQTQPRTHVYGYGTTRVEAMHNLERRMCERALEELFATT